MNLPREFVTRMQSLLGAEYDNFREALCTEDEVKGLRVNGKKLSVKEFLGSDCFSVRPIDYASDGFIIEKEEAAGKHPYHHAGVYYMQDPGAMATVAALPFELWERPHLRILDVCAAPGGKTTQLAALCHAGGGVVLANEYNPARSRILAGNVERMGLDNVCVTNVDSKYLAEWYPSYFDVVVVDAPCSGEGMFRKNVPAISEWSIENVKACAVRQREILGNALQTLAPGGYLLYSTCTYSTEENEEIVAWLLDADEDLELCEISEAVKTCTADGIDVTGTHPALAKCRRFYPHKASGEGQFMALLRRSETGTPSVRAVKDAAIMLNRAERAVVEAFLRETIESSFSGLLLLGGTVSAFPGRETVALPLPPFGVVSAGVALGEVRKGRMVPHHHFFTAYGAEMKNKLVLEPEDALIARYLAGEELETPETPDGYASVCLKVGDAVVSLGGGKVSAGRMKNHYPKGLRKR